MKEVGHHYFLVVEEDRVMGVVEGGEVVEGDEVMEEDMFMEMVVKKKLILGQQ